MGGDAGAAVASGAAVAPAFQAAMSAIGLGTRDPDLLAPEEYVSFSSRVDVACKRESVSLRSGGTNH